jgi:GDP-4-dehydro-6-deoxy-D-mannose reductase
MKKALITGITGMIGSEFSKRLLDEGYDVWGIARNSAESRLNALQSEKIFRTDILDGESINKIVKKVEPSLIIHLAAQAFNGDSWNIESYTHQVNFWGTLNLLKAVKNNVPKSKVIVACSSAEYGMVDTKDQPISESRHLRPITPYGVSKVASENLGYQYFMNFGMKIYLPRLFIHLGTGHPPATAVQNFARQIALIKKGLIKPQISVGNLKTARDFIDVRDGVSGMLTMLEKGKTGEPVNICTGKAYKIFDILKMLIKISEIKNTKIIQKELLFRPSDEILLLGDNSKLLSMGWKQKYSIVETLTDIYKDWLDRVE